MEWYIVSICLGFTYSAYVLLSHFLMDLYNLKPQTVFVNVLCIAALISLCVYPQELRMPKLNTQYALFFLIGLSIFFQNLFMQIGTKMTFNMGIVDGLAVAMYLPFVTFMLYICFGEVINTKKIVGMILACIAGILILC